jgi:hypothetical protein
MSEQLPKYLLALKLDDQDVPYPYHNILIDQLKQYVEYAGYKVKLITDEEAKLLKLPTKEQMEKEENNTNKDQKVPDDKQQRRCVHHTTILADIPKESDTPETREVLNNIIQIVSQIFDNQHIETREESTNNDGTS